MGRRKANSLADSVRADIEIAKGKVIEAQEKFDLWSARLTDAQREVDRLESALAALEGTVAPPKLAPIPQYTDYGTTSIFAKRQIREELTPEVAPVATRPNRVMFNGVEIELEPGFRVGKNSFGEDVLIPNGMPDLLPMEEPLSVRKPDFSLPNVNANTGFSDPKDLY